MEWFFIQILAKYMEIEERMLPMEEQEVIDHELIILSRQTLNLLWRKEQKNPEDLLILYCFYYDSAKRQKTNQPKASISFVCNHFKWGARRARYAKKELIKLGLIEDVIRTDPQTGEITGWFIKVKYAWKKTTISKILNEKPPIQSTTPAQTARVDTKELILAKNETLIPETPILKSATPAPTARVDKKGLNLAQNKAKPTPAGFHRVDSSTTNAYSAIATGARALAASRHCPSDNVFESGKILTSSKNFSPTSGETPDPPIYPPAPDNSQWVRKGDQQTEISETGGLVADSLAEEAAERSSAESSSAERPTPSEPKPQAEKFGREEINSILDRLKAKLRIHDFADTQNWIRRYGRHLARLEREIGEENFWRRIETLMADSFHSRNLSRPRYLYQAIKGMSDSQLDWRKEWYKFHVLTLGAFADQPVSQYADDLTRREQNYFLFPDKRSLADLHMDYFFNQEYLVEYCYRQSAIEEAVRKVLVPEGLELRDFENMIPVYIDGNKTPLVFRRGKKVDITWRPYLLPAQRKILEEKGFDLSTF